MDKTNCNTSPSDFQIPENRATIRGALIHATQTKLLLRRARAESVGYQKGECLNRLLEGSLHICAALELLSGTESELPENPDPAPSDDPECVGNIAQRELAAWDALRNARPQ